MSDFISIMVENVSNPAQVIHHSLRSTEVSYILKNEPKPIINYRHYLENIDIKNIDKVFNKRKEEIKEDYETTERKSIRNGKEYTQKQKLQKNTNLYTEGVIQFSLEQFNKITDNGNNLVEVQKTLNEFCDDFEKQHGVKVLMNSIHLDEGHKNEHGEIIKNPHAHILIENYNSEKHRTGTKTLNYKTLQTELAKKFEHLGFNRGNDYKKLQQTENELALKEGREAKKIKPEHLNHKEFRQVKVKEAELQKELKTKNQYVAGQAKKIELQNDTIKDLKEHINKLKDDTYKSHRENLATIEYPKQEINVGSLLSLARGTSGFREQNHKDEKYWLSNDKKIAVFSDKITISELTPKTIELSLKIVIGQLGNTINLTGTEEQKNVIIQYIANNKEFETVQLVNPEQQARLEQLRLEINEQKNLKTENLLLKTNAEYQKKTI